MVCAGRQAWRHQQRRRHPATLVKELSPAQIAEAEKRVHDFAPKNQPAE